MTSLQALLLGIVEGLTEFLPISSTGHLIITQTLLGIEPSSFLVTFDVAIQLGAIFAVVVFYWQELWNLERIKKLIVAFIPTGVIGFTLFKHIRELLTNPFLVVGTLFVGGVIIIATERWYKNKLLTVGVTSHIGYKEAFLLGLAQTLALIPGVSRSGAMIVGGMYMRLERKVLTEFTFLLAIPTMCSATLYSIYKHPEIITSSGNLSPLLIGLGASFVVGLIVIKLFLTYIKTRSFSVFGYYRILLSIVVFIILSQTMTL